MAQEIVKLEVDSDGIWVSALVDNFSLADLTAFLRAKGVRKYDARAVDDFARHKNRTRQKIAGRSEVDEKSAQIIVQLSKDNMTASITLEAPFFTKPWPTQTDVGEALAKKNVVSGLDQEALKSLTELKLTDETVQVAQGLPSKNGENAWIEYLIDPDNKETEVDLAAQKIDYRTRSVFVNVRKGDKVAVKHPATPGENGESVTGNELKALPGKDAAFPVGSGFEISEDGLVLSAAIDGRLLRKDKKLLVLPELEVKSDVDFSVGNINFNGSVKIAGAVREGFQVIASGSIEIKQMVEGAHVESSNDINITGGVRGMGKGRIIAKGNVFAGFADQAYIRSQGNIEIKNSVFHSDVAAQYKVTVLGGQKAQIAGGKVQAGVEVICQILGSEMGTKTDIVVGIPPEQAERRKELQVLIGQHQENIEKLETSLTYLKKQDQAGALDDAKRAMMASVTKSKFQTQSALKSMSKELQELEERLELSKAKGVVRVKEVCYPGVTITIRGVSYVVREPLKFTAFVLDGGEVRLRAFDG
ncbi:MAG: FapA family protein [Synergistaceae bacterium]|jgi:uncharacterized protein (DUF342 family)|nr:FapA family protein [Synergistaceae bacterium]